MMEKPGDSQPSECWLIPGTSTLCPPATPNPQFSDLLSQPSTHGWEKYLALRNHHPGDPLPQPLRSRTILEPFLTIHLHVHAPTHDNCPALECLPTPACSPWVPMLVLLWAPASMPACGLWTMAWSPWAPRWQQCPEGWEPSSFMASLLTLPPSPTWSWHSPPRGLRCTKGLP